MYKLAKDSDGNIRSDTIIQIVDGVVSFIPNDPNNGAWQRYQAWLAEDPANQPEEAD